jgi:TonB family protein
LTPAPGESLPRRFGPYLLTAFLGEDALGRVYRALGISGERGFARVRILEGPDISEDAVLDAIQENGEIHTFLKNPAIARGVNLDAVDGTPFLAWNEESGRTLDVLRARAADQGQSVPYEHALLIVEKVATALDHAYNTMVDGERTLHGLVWPGFISISDDGETRLTGFGLAQGLLPSLGRPRFAREIAPYLAPEVRAQARVGKNSDVYSVGAILFELLTGRLPNASDPLADLKTVQREGVPLAPEAVAVMRMCLGTAEARFQSSGEMRRELGKLLFSGPYSPSTFNLAFFLNGLFGAEIDSEGKARSKEASLDLAQFGSTGSTAAPEVAAVATAPARAAPPSTPVRSRAASTGLPPPAAVAPRRAPFVLGTGLLVAAAIGGGAYVVLHRPAPAAAPPRPRPTSIPIPPTAVPIPTPSGPTSAMTDAQFKDEVARRVAQEMKKLDAEMRRNTAAAVKLKPPAPASGAEGETRPESTTPAAPRPEAPAPTAPPVRAAQADPTPAPTPEREPPATGSVGPAPASGLPEVDVAPKILRVIKPIYPPFALRARIGGIVLLRVLVSEAGLPLDVQVLKGVSGGLTESAVAAVRTWKFEPATRGGAPVRGFVTIPIPFVP